MSRKRQRDYPLPRIASLFLFIREYLLYSLLLSSVVDMTMLPAVFIREVCEIAAIFAVEEVSSVTIAGKIHEFSAERAVIRAHAAVGTAGNLCQLFRGQLRKFLIQGFNFLFEGFEFFSSFHRSFSFVYVVLNVISFNTYMARKCYTCRESN